MTVSNPPQSRGHVEAGGDQPPQQPPQSPQPPVTDEPEEPEPDPEALIAAFPLAKLQKLEELVSNTRWVIPVLPKGELEVLLETSISLAKAGADKRCEPCMRFYREGLLISFTRIMTDEAVSSWRLDIHKCILRNCERMIELCVLKLDDDWFPLLDLLALVMNPNNKFHMYNSSRHTEFPIEEPFARSVDVRMARGWLVDLINRFGFHGGFKKLLDRFTKNSEGQKNNGLNVALIYAYVRPFGQCYELLTPNTVSTYLLPIVEAVPKFLESLSDEELKKEAKNESKNDALSAIVKSLKSLASTIPSQEENVRSLELFRLKMILRQLQISSFGGKMNALNEVNRVISSVSYYPNQGQQQPQQQPAQKESDEEFLTADRMATWLKENKVLQITLQDNLHQPQYVEKMEKVIRFLIKEKVLSMEDLDDIWAAQVGQHEAIVKNVHDLLAKLAWDFTPPQMDHLFERFQASWSTANVKQREKLLELIRHLAEDDKEGVMADKVLNLFWNLAHANDVAIDIMDQALSAHIKILDYSCTQYREAQKSRWLGKCIEELKTNSTWVLPALKQIREICCLYQEAPHNTAPSAHHAQRQGSSTMYRHEVINNLQLDHALVILVADNLTSYVDQVRHNPPKVLAGNPEDLYPDGRYNHVIQVQERLNFLRFLLKDGQLWLCAPQAKQIWNCLAENAVFAQDREACFKWFSKLMGDEPDLDPEINRDFFENNILQLDPSLMTESGIKCFDRFFKEVNRKENKLIAKRRAYLMDDLELIGMDYIWRLVLNSNEEIANKAIELLKETFTNLGPRLQTNQVEIHEDFISSCFDRLKASYDTITLLEQEKDVKFGQEATKLCRVLKVLHEYVQECDADFCDERTLVPLFRASRGKQLILLFRFPNQGRQMDDLEIYTHTNDTLASVKRQIIQRLKGNPSQIKVELKYEGEITDSADDRKILANLPFKDKTILEGKLIPINHNSSVPASSPDSSSDSSTSSPQHHYDGGPNVEVEQCLPGVIIAQERTYTAFLLQLADLGCSLGHTSLRDAARAVLTLIPADSHTASKIRNLCTEQVKNPASNPQHGFDSLFFTTSSSQTLYNLEVCYSLLMPSNVTTHEKAFDLQMNIVKAKGIPAFMGMLTRNDFLSTADLRTKQLAYLTVLKVCKLVFAVAGHSLVHMVAEACQPDSTSSVSPSVHSQAVILQQALHQIPSPSQEVVIRNISQRLATQLLEAGAQHMPNQANITSIIRLAWASAAGNLGLTNGSPAELHEPFKTNKKIETKEDDIALACEAIEVLALAIALHPQCLESLIKDSSWHQFIIDLTLMSNYREIRITAADQFLLIATRCSGEQHPIRFFITLLFTVLSSTATEQADQSLEYFVLLTRLLSYAAASNLNLNTAESLLNTEITWLKKIRENVRKSGSAGCHDNLLEGHMWICRDLLAFMSADKKYDVGSNPKTSVHLVKDLVEDFIFPASKMHVIYKSTNKIPMGAVIPVCNTGGTLMAAFDLLVALATGCVPNLKLTADMLTEMFYNDKDDVILDWEYLPPVGPRPQNGFVGLKNAGATCYMNSVLQQLFMIESVRNGVLEAEEACNDPDEDFSGEDRNEEINENDNSEVVEQSTKEYNLTILKNIQAIFGHLAYSKRQLYVPRGLWKHFRMHGEPVNLREQQDADEFFMRLKEAVEDGLKALGYEQTLTKILSGSFSDQKICKTCPCRYSSEVTFSAISVDVRNHSNLTDSLVEYVKGDLLDGSNAYKCERCDKKVDTIKRLCVKKLPPILVIQLKRFDYDLERMCLIKFNDYFEFPRELDMEPYTVGGLAKIEGEAIDCDPSDLDGRKVSKYRLRGMVVHSGQASGGHYYSFIRNKDSDGEFRWYKFDDGDVTEIKLEDEEELKAQCYGGEYMSEVFDPLVKRMSYRKQKRWWNAYMLFYTRLDYTEDVNTTLVKEMSALNLGSKNSVVPMPIEKSIQKQNVHFLHHHSQYTQEYFAFMRKIINANAPYVNSEKLGSEAEELAMITVQLASKFLFNSGLHSKKSLRGPAQEWYELLTIHLRYSKAARAWFCQEALFAHPSRFCEYILECPTAEVRQAFVRIIVFIAHFSLNDGAYPVPMILQQQVQQEQKGSSSAGDQVQTLVERQGNQQQTLSDYLLQIVLSLLWMEVPEHGKHLSQYFSLFVMYASLGVAEKKQLLKLNVPATFINVAMDEGPGPPIKYQYSNELGKLYQVVSQLIRCCDISAKCQSAGSGQGKAPLPNPYLESSCTGVNNQPLMTMQPQVYELIFKRYSYLKKIIEEANAQEDTKKLLQFCSWENPTFSHAVLYELLWQVAIAYTYELRPYLDLLLNILLMEDSWQVIRIQKTLKGIPDEHTAREGLFDIIQKSKSHYQKRAYQCIKLLVALFSQCEAAKNVLDESEDIKRKWSWAVEWLNDELERNRGPYPGSGQFSYNNWSPPAQSNETGNGYFLERSHSARLTLEKACELLPEEDLEADTDAIMGEDTATAAQTSGGTETEGPQRSSSSQSGHSTTAKKDLQQQPSSGSPDPALKNTNSDLKKEVSKDGI